MRIVTTELTLSTALSSRNIDSVLSYMIEHHGGAGPDGMPVTALKDYWHINGENIRSLAAKGE